MKQDIKRGDIFYARLDPTVGSEQGGMRPVLIISNDVGNRFGSTVIVAVITSKKVGRTLPTHMCIRRIKGLPQMSVILLEQIRTIDKCRLKVKIAHLSKSYMNQITAPLLISLGVTDIEK